MYCPFCHTVHAEAGLFCPVCGSPLQPEPPAEHAPPPERISPEAGPAQAVPSRRSRGKRLLFPAAAVLLIAAAVLLLRLFQAAPGPALGLQSHSSCWVRNDEATLFLFDGEEAARMPGGHTYMVQNRSADGSAVLCLEGTDNAYDMSGPFYLLTARGLFPIVEECDEIGLSFCGRWLFYVDGLELHLVDTATLSDTLVTARLASSHTRSVCFSPDGEDLYYAAYHSDTSAVSVCRWTRDGREEAVLKGAVPVAASNGGDYLYYTPAYGDGFFVWDGHSSVLLHEEAPRFFYLDRTGRQMLFSTDDGTFLCREGGGSVPLSHGSAALSGASALMSAALPANAGRTQTTSGVILDAADLTGLGYLSLLSLSSAGTVELSLYYFGADGSLRSHKTGQYFSPAASADGRTLLLNAGQELSLFDLDRPDEGPEVIASAPDGGQLGGLLCPDGRRALVYNPEGKILSLWTRGGELTELARDVEGYALSAGGETLYYTVADSGGSTDQWGHASGTLWSCAGKGNPRPVEGMEQVFLPRALGGGILCLDEEGSAWFAMPGQHFRKLCGSVIDYG